MQSDIFARNLLLLSSLDEIIQKIQKEDIKIILLKGCAFVELGIFKLSKREMSDIDILVKKQDEKRFIEILKDLKFLEMPESSSAYFKTIKPSIPPVIVDLHTDFEYKDDLNEIWKNKIKIKENVFSLSWQDMVIFEIMHSFLHHGYLDEKTILDIKKIFESYKDQEKLKLEVIEKANRLKISKLVSKALFKAGINLSKEKIKISTKEHLFSPLIFLALKKHYNFNEYILPFLYNPSFGVKMLFPSSEFLLRRYGSSSFKTRIKRIFSLLAKLRQ